MSVDLCPVVEDFTSPHFAYLDLFDLLRHQILAQEVLVDDLLSWLTIIDDIVDQTEEGDQTNPTLRLGIHLRIEEEALYPSCEALLEAF